MDPGGFVSTGVSTKLRNPTKTEEKWSGAGEGNRTLVSGLGSPHSTIEPHPHREDCLVQLNHRGPRTQRRSWSGARCRTASDGSQSARAQAAASQPKPINVNRSTSTDQPANPATPSRPNPTQADPTCPDFGSSKGFCGCRRATPRIRRRSPFASLPAAQPFSSSAGCPWGRRWPRAWLRRRWRRGGSGWPRTWCRWPRWGCCRPGRRGWSRSRLAP